MGMLYCSWVGKVGEGMLYCSWVGKVGDGYVVLQLRGKGRGWVCDIDLALKIKNILAVLYCYEDFVIERECQQWLESKLHPCLPNLNTKRLFVLCTLYYMQLSLIS